MEETTAGAENPQHAIQLPERVESSSAGQNRELHPLKSDLYDAAVNGDWEKAKSLLGEDPELAAVAITEGGETALHVATGARQVNFVESLMDYFNTRQDYLRRHDPVLGILTRKDLKLKDRNGNTAFCIAAAAGCIEIAEIMLKSSPELLSIRGLHDLTPLNMAVLLGKREMAMFLYDRDASYLKPYDRNCLFFDSITNDLYDFALKLLEQDRELASVRHGSMGDRHKVTALHVLARKPTSIFDQEATSSPALQLLNRIWDVAKGDPNIRTLIREPSNLLFDAAKSGNSLFLSELIRSHPDLIYELDQERRTIFHVALFYRQFSVFNLINKLGVNKEIIATMVDHKENSMLHLAAMLYRPPESALTSAALEMQQELIIFQEVEKLMQPALRGAQNVDGQTPHELFARQHEELLQHGGVWMNKTANSCSLVATLITTVAFAAVFTVPGGIDSKTGTPLLLKRPLFHVHAMSNAIALSSSSFSILMFLSILTSGHTQSQFLRALPLKLMFGLVALFVSIIFMMITFTSSYFLLYHDGSYTIPTLAAVFVTLPVTLFVLLQYPLVRDIFHLTRHSGILSGSGFLSKSDKKMLETQSRRG